MEARYTEEAILARQRRNKRSGKSEARRQRWLAEQDVEWGAAWWLALWRWEKLQTQEAWQRWARQEQRRIWVARQIQTRRMMEEVRKWKAEDLWLRSLWQMAGEKTALSSKEESTEKECEPALGSLVDNRWQ